PFLRSARLVRVRTEAPGTNPVAVEIVTTDGRTDLIISHESPTVRSAPPGHAPGSAGRTTAEGLTVEGAYGFIAWRQARSEIAKLMGGTRLETEGLVLTADAAAYTGTVEAALTGDPADQRLRFSSEIPELGRRPDRTLIVANDAAQDAAYTVRSWPAANI